MKFTALKSIFLLLLKTVSGTVEKKFAPGGAADLVLTVTDAGQLFAKAGDNDLQVACAAGEVMDFEPGAVELGFKKLYDIVRTLPNGAEVGFDARGPQIQLSCGTSKFALAKCGVVELPTINTDFIQEFSLPAKLLVNNLGKTALAMADMDVRYFLNGMLWQLSADNFVCVTSDGHRLAYSSSSANLDINNKRDVLVPRRTILEILRLLADSSEAEVKIKVSASSIRLNVNGVELLSRLLEGKFPNYQQIIPKTEANIMRVSKSKLKESCARVAVLFSEKYKAVRFALGANKLKLCAATQENDSAEEVLDVDYQGIDIDIGFNIKYIIDFLGVIADSEVEMVFSGSSSAVLMRGLGCSSNKYIIMPMRV